MALSLVVGCGGDGYGAGGENPVAPTGTEALSIVSGGEQIGTIGGSLAEPLVVGVTRDGSPAGGLSVLWSVQGGAQLGSFTTTTGANGQSPNTVSLVGASPLVQVTATAAGASAPVVFRAYAVPAGARVVDVRNNEFVPADVTVAAGGTVAWVWRDTSRNHNVLPSGQQPAPSGGLESSPKVYAVTFPTPGTYRYYCNAHGTPSGTGMAGTVTVN